MSQLIKNKTAFTLIEILVAIGILAGAIASLMPLINVSAMLSVEDERMLQAVTLANNKITEIERDIEADIKRGKFPDEISQAGLFDPPFDDFKWEYSLQKVEIPVTGSESEGENVVFANVLKIISKEMSKAVREVKVTVTWGDREEDKEEQTYTLTTHVVNIK